MQTQRIPDAAALARLSEAEIDAVVLDYMLCGPSWPWSVDEIVRELGDENYATDALGRLEAMGLVHRLGDFVFPTRTARRAAELEIGTV
jgi:hypothetical protein